MKKCSNAGIWNEAFDHNPGEIRLQAEGKKKHAI